MCFKINNLAQIILVLFGHEGKNWEKTWFTFSGRTHVKYIVKPPEKDRIMAPESKKGENRKYIVMLLSILSLPSVSFRLLIREINIEFL